MQNVSQLMLGRRVERFPIKRTANDEIIKPKLVAIDLNATGSAFFIIYNRNSNNA